MAVKLDDLGQPRGIGGLPVVIGRGQVVFCNGKCRQDQEKDGGNKFVAWLKLRVTGVSPLSTGRAGHAIGQRRWQRARASTLSDESDLEQNCARSGRQTVGFSLRACGGLFTT